MNMFWLYFWLAALTAVIGFGIQSYSSGEWEAPFFALAIALTVAAIIKANPDVD